MELLKPIEQRRQRNSLQRMIIRIKNSLAPIKNWIASLLKLIYLKQKGVIEILKFD
jgi:hypothetical protein